MPRVTLGTLIKIVLASLAVGLVMAWSGLTPQEVFKGAFERLGGAFDWAVDAFGWTVSYVLLGAAVVVPVWFLLYLLRAFRGRR